MTIACILASFSEYLNDLPYLIHLQRHVLIAGPLIGATCGLLSVYVVLRRMALISEGISHAGFGGFSLAILVGYYISAMDNILSYEIVAGIFCLCTALAIGYVTRKKRVTEDSAIGIFLVATVAFGMVLLQFRHSLPSNGTLASAQTVENLLFGGFASVVFSDVAILAVTLLTVATIIGMLYHQFLYTTLDEEMARINGVNTRLINFLLLTMISLVIVLSIRMVGSLMITALMVIPGATANMLSRRFGYVLLLSILIEPLVARQRCALVLVPPFDTYDPGPDVVLLLFLIFAVVWAIRHFRPKRLSPMPCPKGTEEQGHSGSFGAWPALGGSQCNESSLCLSSPCLRASVVNFHCVRNGNPNARDSHPSFRAMVTTKCTKITKNSKKNHKERRRRMTWCSWWFSFDMSGRASGEASNWIPA